MSADRFPILIDSRVRERGPKVRVPVSIPWELIASHNQQAMSNHSQSIHCLASRGGLSPCEAVAVLTDHSWAPMTWQEAQDKLVELVGETIEWGERW